MKRIAILYILLNLFFLSSYGQKVRKIRARFGYSSENLFKLANEYFNDGNYDACIGLLDSAWVHHSDYSKKNREDILTLKTKALIEKDDLEKANAAAYSVFKNNPHYELIPADNEEDFNRLMQRYTVYPLFTVTARNALLHPMLKNKKTYSVLENLDYNTPYKAQNWTLLYYLSVEYNLKWNVAINAEFIYNHLTYTRSFYKGTDWKMNLDERMTLTEFPVSLRRYSNGQNNFYVFAGVGAGWIKMTKALANASISYSTQDVFSGVTSLYSKNSYDINTLPMRNNNLFEWTMELGIGYRFNNIRIGINGRYYGALNSFTKSSARFSNESLINDYFYIDNKMKFNKAELAIELSYTLKNKIVKK